MPLLSEMLLSGSNSLRAATANTLAAIGPAAATAVSELLLIAKMQSSDHSIPSAAARAVGRVGASNEQLHDWP